MKLFVANGWILYYNNLGFIDTVGWLCIAADLNYQIELDLL